MRAEQTVNEMAQVVLSRQARALAQRTGEPLLEALEAVLETPAGRQLEELTAYCVDIDPHTPCMYEWLSKLPSAGAYVRIMHCGSTTLKSAVRSGPHQDEEARYWQANLLFERVSEQAGHPV